jgi:hypothetical protein
VGNRQAGEQNEAGGGDFLADLVDLGFHNELNRLTPGDGRSSRASLYGTSLFIGCGTGNRVTQEHKHQNARQKAADEERRDARPH